ncbi:MAG: hypothetical protein HYY16_06970, partial [Planctomycetes bacterium]|nr:hypothetical protein [Planctomycetota bacterium]
IATLDEYRRFLAREMTTEGADGLYLPKLRFKDNTPAENLEIMRYFGMELIAYPKSRKFYVTIDPDHDLYGRSNDFTYIRNFSNRVIYRTSPYFDDFRREAARHVGIASEELVVAQLLKPASAAYLGWKEAECARHVGVTLEDVTACDATFTKTAFGAWIIRIDALALKDGRTIQVQDFEWARLQRGAR